LITAMHTTSSFLGCSNVRTGTFVGAAAQLEIASAAPSVPAAATRPTPTTYVFRIFTCPSAM
jgi:hypothetical protein